MTPGRRRGGATGATMRAGRLTSREEVVLRAAVEENKARGNYVLNDRVFARTNGLSRRSFAGVLASLVRKEYLGRIGSSHRFHDAEVTNLALEVCR